MIYAQRSLTGILLCRVNLFIYRSILLTAFYRWQSRRDGLKPGYSPFPSPAPTPCAVSFACGLVIMLDISLLGNIVWPMIKLYDLALDIIPDTDKTRRKKFIVPKVRLA